MATPNSWWKNIDMQWRYHIKKSWQFKWEDMRYRKCPWNIIEHDFGKWQWKRKEKELPQ